MTMDRDLGDEPPPAYRDTPPDILSPIDETAPVSGHRPPPDRSSGPSGSAEHDWASASDHVYPVLRPPGTHGTMLAEIDAEHLAQEGLKKHALPLIDPGPAGLAIAYALREPAYDVLVNADHLLSWGVDADRLRETATANLRAWSESAPWTDEVDGGRRLLSSDTGEGSDAARILLPEVRSHLAAECGDTARVLVGVPDRDLLLASSLMHGDADFAGQLAVIVAEIAEEAHEPIDRRLFELVGPEHELVPFAG